MSSETGDSPSPALYRDELERLRSENESLEARLGSRLRWRKILALVLVVLTSLSMVSASLAIWVHQVVFDTDRFMEAVAPALDRPELYSAIGDRVSDPVLGALAIETRLTETLEQLDTFLSEGLLDATGASERGRQVLEGLDRPSLADLAPPIAAAVEERIAAGVQSFFTSGEFVSRFPELVLQAHEAAVALARDDLVELPNVYIEGGEVRLNLIPFVGEAMRRVASDIRSVLPNFDLRDSVSSLLVEGRNQLAEAIGARLPPDFGQVTFMTDDSLEQVQALAVQLDRSVWILVLLTLLLLIATIAVSPDRRVTLLHLGIGIFLAVVLAAVAVRRLEEVIIAEVGESRGAVAADLLSDTFSGLRSLELIIAVVAVVIAIVAYLAGRPAWLRQTGDLAKDWTAPGEDGSRLDRWVCRYARFLRIAGTMLAAAALFVVGLDLIPVAMIGLVLTAYLGYISAACRRAPMVQSVP